MFFAIEMLVVALAIISLKIPIVGTINLLIAFGIVMVTVIGGGYAVVDQLFASAVTLLAVVLPIVGMRK